MKVTYLITTAVIGLALAAPLAAHHNSPAEPDIGDMMGRHEDAIEALADRGAMDPSNGSNSSLGSMPEDSGESNRVGYPTDPDNQGIDKGGNRGGIPW